MFDSLLTEGTIGSMAVPNRVVMPPMTTRYCSADGRVTEQTRAYYRERAVGGTGLLVFEATYPCEFHKGRHLLVDDSYVDGFRTLVREVHEEGSKIAVQLNPHRATSDKTEPVAPSALTTPQGKSVPAVTKETLESLVADFAAGAERAKRAGFDGIEIHAASGYLVNQFLSPRTNRRTDEYGGSIDGRTRFARELLAAVRKEVGPEYPVWFRIPGDEFLDGGITVSEAKRIARRLEKAGSDAFHVTAGHNWNGRHVLLFGHEPQGRYADLAAAVRSAVDVPVVAVGRISDPAVAAEIVDDGKADFVAMGRAHIADPHLVRKLERGTPDRIRRCVGGMEGCRDLVDDHESGGYVTCTVNPTAGREGAVDDAHVDEPKTVAVVGGGPAGLEAARIAAKRGHRVTLYEADSALGGQLRRAGRAPAKRDYARLLEFFEAELDAYDVEVQLDHEIAPDQLDQLSADSIVVAVGGDPHVPTVDGISDAVVADRVCVPAAVLTDEDPSREPTVVLGSDDEAVDVAMFLARNDVRTTLVSEGPLLPRRSSTDTESDFSLTTRPFLLDRLASTPGIETRAVSSIERITDAGVVVRNDEPGRRDHEKRETIPCDRIVLTGRVPNTAFKRQADGRSVTVVGDAEQSRGLYVAIHEGAEAGRSV